MKEGEWVDQIWGLMIEALQSERAPPISPRSDRDRRELAKKVGEGEEGWLEWLSSKTSSLLGKESESDDDDDDSFLSSNILLLEVDL